MNLFWFLLGIGIGVAGMGWFMNGRFLKALTQIEAGVDGLVAEHDIVVRGLISRLPDNDPGRRKSDPLS